MARLRERGRQRKEQIRTLAGAATAHSHTRSSALVLTLAHWGRLSSWCFLLLSLLLLHFFPLLSVFRVLLPSFRGTELAVGFFGVTELPLRHSPVSPSCINYSLRLAVLFFFLILRVKHAAVSSFCFSLPKMLHFLTLIILGQIANLEHLSFT